MRRILFYLLIPLCLMAVLADGGGTGREEGLSVANVFAWGRRGKGMPGQLEKPRSVAVDRLGSVFVLDVGGRVQRFDADGAYRDAFPLPDVSGGNPQYIAAGASGTLLVADTHNNRILRLGKDGVFHPVIESAAASPGAAKPGELFWPCAVAESPDGFIYTLEYGGHDRVQKWTGDGAWVACWGRFGSGDGEFRRPSGIAIAGNGDVHVADSVNNRIQVFDRDGKWLRAWDASSSPRGRLSCPFDVAIGENGLVAVLEYAAGRFRMFSADGVELLAWGGRSRGNDGFSYPWGMTIDNRNTIFIADTLNHRIVTVALKGD